MQASKQRFTVRPSEYPDDPEIQPWRVVDSATDTTEERADTKPEALAVAERLNAEGLSTQPPWWPQGGGK